MSFLDKLLGRDKKGASDAPAESSMADEGMSGEQQGMASEPAGQTEGMPPAEGERDPQQPSDN
jgi:hypothetical protein